MHPQASPQALGYVGIRARNIEDWAGYDPNLLGLELVDKSRATLAFRMDDRKQRVLIDADGGEGIKFFGWEVADGGALDTLAARLEATRVKVARGARALADERRVKDLIVLNDPVGNRLEIFHGAEIANEPFKPGRNISGFRTGAHGLGHVVLHVERFKEMMAFYRDVFGFRVSDYFLRPYPVYFFHVNPRHHSLAFAATGRNAVHHMMLELYSLNDVGQGYDLATAEEGRLAVSLGRHCGDWVTSFYTWSPSAFMVEYGWGGRTIDPPGLAGKRAQGRTEPVGPRARLARPGAARGSACHADRQCARRPAPSGAGDRGNYDVMTGICPWFDGVKSRQKSA